VREYTISIVDRGPAMRADACHWGRAATRDDIFDDADAPPGSEDDFK
jgi:hypothetical protein